jgi:DNA-binding XRE family transcriptional regulator
MKEKKFIYALCCPFTNDVHYIGKTTVGMLRPLEHLKESHSEKVKKWVDSLKEIGHAPKVIILQNVSIEEDLDGRERYWIQYYLNKKALLLNSVLVTPLLISKDLDKILGDGQGMEFNKIGNFVKQKRKKVGLTQDEFAKKSGIALTVLRKIEQNKTNYNIQGLIQVLKMFGCVIDVCKR